MSLAVQEQRGLADGSRGLRTVNSWVLTGQGTYPFSISILSWLKCGQSAPQSGERPLVNGHESQCPFVSRRPAFDLYVIYRAGQFPAIWEQVAFGSLWCQSTWHLWSGNDKVRIRMTEKGCW